MYRPPSRPPRGARATHLHAVRRDRDLSQTQAFELVYAGLGISPKSRAVYLAIDMGDRQPTATEAEYLASVFGWPSEPTEATESGDPLVAALTRQSAAIEALVEELRLARAGQVVANDVLLQAIAAAVGGPAPQGTSAGSGHEAPAGTGR